MRWLVTVLTVLLIAGCTVTLAPWGGVSITDNCFYVGGHRRTHLPGHTAGTNNPASGRPDVEETEPHPAHEACRYFDKTLLGMEIHKWF